MHVAIVSRLSLLVLAIVFCSWLQSSFATDIYWTNNSTPASFNTGNNWTGGAVPTGGDSAYFTNVVTQTIQFSSSVTNANAFFNSGSPFKTLDIGSQTYWLTNSFVIGQGAADNGNVSVTTGTLLVTNSDSSARLIVGQAGPGRLDMNGGTVIADQIFSTNTAGPSRFVFNYDNLRTYGSIFNPPASSDFVIGNVSGQTATWNILGGTNTVIDAAGGFATKIGSATGSKGIVNVSGIGTVFTNAGILAVGHAGADNELNVTGGGTVYQVGLTRIGVVGVNSTLTVLGSNSTYNGIGDMDVGVFTAGNRLVVTNGGRVRSATGTIGNGSGGNDNLATVTGSGSLWSNTTSLIVGGSTTVRNQLTVNAGGEVYAGSSGTIVGNTALALSNSITVSTGGFLNNLNTLQVGLNGAYNTLILTNGGRASNTGDGTVGTSSTSIGNKAIVTGANSVWSNKALLYVGNVGSLNELSVLDGGTVTVGSDLHIGEGNSISANLSSNNTVTVSGSGAVLKVNGAIYVGSFGDNNQLIVTNHGTVLVTNATVNGNVRVGQGVGHTNSVLITGDGSYLLANKFFVGANGTTLGAGNALITQGGTLEANQIEDGSINSGTITNSGGIFQFTLAPFITIHTPGSIVLTNGTISFRDLATAATTPVAGINYYGDNTFRLNHSTNATGLASYTFDSIANTGNASNYQALALINGASWRSGSLTIGSGGTMLVSNSISRVDASFISTGTVKVVKSMMTFGSNVVISGKYISDPSTNTFLGNVTLTSGGTLAGGVGDRFEFGKDLLISNASNPSATFNLASSTVAFINGGSHTNAITGTDLGYTNGVGYADGFRAVNFAYGQLTLDSTNDQVFFTSGSGATSNALYVNWLDLSGFTSQFGGNVSNMVTALLDAPANINIYYGATSFQPNDAFLGNQVYTLASGGLLLPAVPEPSTMALLLTAGVLLMSRTRRSR